MAETALFCFSLGFAGGIAGLSAEKNIAYSLLLLPIAYLGADILCRIRGNNWAGVAGSAYEYFLEKHNAVKASSAQKQF